MEKLWKTEDLMEFMGIESRAGIYHGIKRGTLPPPLRAGNRLRWHPRKVYAWLGLDEPDPAPPTQQAQPHKRRGPGRPRKEVQR
jgi:predicted DNA-binding transcriptional regulator AlpA